uniref:Centrosomal protein of 44 kDa n=1 Tax=Labrus bergylta TaxID=56723 RepID=A0A3Q3G263_9LABR|nr:centrosomal protein of 44 kDa-like [Labrus bergylta]XP_020493425.1 centrosomal protein of 44 kDa-like [Labrus bergylta]
MTENVERFQHLKVKMLSTGDVQGCLRKLETLLRVIKYPGQVDYNSLSKGDPSAFLPIVSFTLTSFSPPFAEQLTAAGFELTGKTDLRFTDTFYKVLRDIFHYKPVLTKQQFLQWGFSQRKISVVCDVINFVQQKHNQLKKPRVRCPAQNKEGRPDGRGEVQPTLIAPDQPLVVNHTEYQSIFHAERFSSSSPGNMITEEEADEEEEEEEDEQEGDRLQSHSELEGRLSALEAQLQSLQPGLDRIRVLERRLEDLERRRHTDKSEGDVVIISRESWENLMSRVVLLETQSELRDTQLSVPPPCVSSSSAFSNMSVASKEDLKERLERITNMMKSTSSLLKNSESSTTDCK